MVQYYVSTALAQSAHRLPPTLALLAAVLQWHAVIVGRVCSKTVPCFLTPASLCVQAPAGQAAVKAGVPSSVPCTLVNKVCSSGMKAVVIAAQTILTGDNDIVVAGGMESMSNIPHYLPQSRKGIRLGHGQILDGLLRDGLHMWDPHVNVHMGDCAELCAQTYQITREEMDDHALLTFHRAQAAAPYSRAELVPVQLPGSKSDPAGRVLDHDESLGKINEQKLRQLKPHFKQDGGVVTAGNSSPITDGGCALVLVSAAKAAELKCPVLAVIRGYGDANQDPEWFTTAPAAVTPKVGLRCTSLVALRCTSLVGHRYSQLVMVPAQATCDHHCV
eukprot:GHUV01017308.1.p1 GENE.GHUV01017308.1~~GHUV01017308.1.p1  ORF type:complete len:332 (+),score=71.86 GHUV01017308.1:512-1507(+)